MQLAQYLMCVATRHEQAKDEHEEESRELRLKERQRTTGRRSFRLTYGDEMALLKGVVASVRGKPSSLKKLSFPALGALAYILRAKMANEPFIEGHEIIESLVYDPERTIDYLNGFTELKDQEWIRFIETPGMAFTDQPPYCWLQANIELGNTFHQAMGVVLPTDRSFTSNDAYLDAVFAYLQAMISESSGCLVTDPDVDLSTLQPEGWFRRIVSRVQSATCDLPAVEAQTKYGLSIFQYLTLIGLLGMQDGDVSYEFDDPQEVTSLFAKGRTCRKRMQDHLFGEKSPLMRQRLVEGTQGSFGETIRLTSLGTTALIGNNPNKRTTKDLRSPGTAQGEEGIAAVTRHGHGSDKVVDIQ